VRLLHQKKYQHLDNQILVVEEQHDKDLVKEKQLEEPVQEVTVQYLHCGGSSSTQFKMAGNDPMIRLPKFRGEPLEYPEKNLFIREEI
jgi:hypothetical protein